MRPELFVGPVSKNVVDAVLEYKYQHDAPLGLIPSRRQIDFDGGYVNNWTTKTFVDYCKRKNYDGIERDYPFSASMYSMKYERDHGGIGQSHDDEYEESLVESIRTDARNFDIIHVDPWKKYSSIDDAAVETAREMSLAYIANPYIRFEIGTEQAIRPMTASDLEIFLKRLYSIISPNLQSRIEYIVIQSGTGLIMNQNIGVYDENRLMEMLLTVKRYGKKSKEHNGDHLTVEQIKRRLHRRPSIVYRLGNVMRGLSALWPLSNRC